MMDEKAAANPFSGLDKALLRSTQPRAEASEPTPAPAKPERTPRRRPAVEAAEPADQRAPTPPPSDQSVIEELQRALRAVGKEIFNVRIAPEEKRRVDAAVHAFKTSGVRTSANDLGRVALNYLLADHDSHGEQSILSRVLASKRA